METILSKTAPMRGLEPRSVFVLWSFGPFVARLVLRFRLEIS